MSAKHIAAVKDASKKNKGGPKGGSGQKGPSPNASKKLPKDDEDQDPPEVVEALTTFRKAEKAAKENPGMAASVLWKIAKALWTFRQSLETAKVLSLLIRILSELQATTGTAPSVTGVATAQGSLSPTQISMTLYLSRLAMARLFVYQSPELASQYYLDAIQGRWQIDHADLQTINEMVNTSSVTQLLDHCRTFLSTHPKTEKLMVVSAPSASGDTAAKKPADPNLKLLVIFLESASMLAQKNATVPLKSSQKTIVSTVDRIQGETALACYAMAAVLTEASGDKAGTAAILRTMETGDFVRMQTTISLLNSCCDMAKYQDVQTVAEVANAVISQDNDYLYNGASWALEHLMLLIQENREDGGSRANLLLCRHSTPAASVETLTRVHQLVT
ncbi:hypothetical protein BGZ80_010147 [Entomortierella chlamydospora]|uniref:Uncharacterized protein n=1 Tax=Entomortierella chlamydospora TaxID=101097 RepID=A0A9P6MV57_9FUNG|nr:hypothetical protein BGZ80_010147 [Entomortierella chlamydospora]